MILPAIMVGKRVKQENYSVTASYIICYGKSESRSWVWSDFLLENKYILNVVQKIATD